MNFMNSQILKRRLLTLKPAEKKADGLIPDIPDDSQSFWKPESTLMCASHQAAQLPSQAQSSRAVTCFQEALLWFRVQGLGFRVQGLGFRV